MTKGEVKQDTLPSLEERRRILEQASAAAAHARALAQQLDRMEAAWNTQAAPGVSGSPSGVWPCPSGRPLLN